MPSQGVFIRGFPRGVLEEVKKLTGARTYAEAIETLLSDTYGDNSRLIYMSQDVIELLREIVLFVGVDEYQNNVKRVLISFLKFLHRSLIAAELGIVDYLYKDLEEEEWRRLMVELLRARLKKLKKRGELENVIKEVGAE
ncbi:MAG: hypothetical protein QXZ11_03165 [Thermoproteota archaeon]